MNQVTYTLQVWLDEESYIGSAVSSRPQVIEAFGKGLLEQYPHAKLHVDVFDRANPHHEGSTMLWSNFLEYQAKAASR